MSFGTATVGNNSSSSITGTGNSGTVTNMMESTIASTNSKLNLTNASYTNINASASTLLCESCEYLTAKTSGGYLNIKSDRYGKVNAEGESKIIMNGNQYTDLTSTGTVCVLERNHYTAVNTTRGNVRANENQLLIVSGTDGNVVVENTKNHEIKQSPIEKANWIQFIPGQTLTGNQKTLTISLEEIKIDMRDSSGGSCSFQIGDNTLNISFTGSVGRIMINGNVRTTFEGGGTFHMEKNGDIKKLSDGITQHTLRSGRRIVGYYGQAEIRGNEYQVGIFKYRVDPNQEEFEVTVNGSEFEEGSIQTETLSTSQVIINARKAGVGQTLVIAGPEVEAKTITNPGAQVIVTVRIPKEKVGPNASAPSAAETDNGGSGDAQFTYNQGQCHIMFFA